MTAGLSLALLVVVAYVARGRGILGGGGLVLAGALWLATNKKMEGPTILHLTYHHGFTVGDLSGLLAMALGAWQIWTARARSPRDRNL